VVQDVAHPLLLGAQVLGVERVRLGLDRQVLADRQPVPLQALELARVVGQDADRRQAQIRQDLTVS
jgi:hypothetical protein